MPNPYIMTTAVVCGPVTLVFQSPTKSDHDQWDVLAEESDKPLAAAERDALHAKVTALLWSLLKHTKLDGVEVTAEGWQEQLRESYILDGANGVGVGVKLFRFRTVPLAIGGLD